MYRASTTHVAATECLWTATGTLVCKSQSSSHNVTTLENFAEVLQPGSMGCATAGFSCASGSTCVEDKCVSKTSSTSIDVSENPKTYYGHNGTHWLGGFGQTCTGSTLCHRGMECMNGVCQAYLAPDATDKDCRKDNYICVPGYACSSKDGICRSAGKDTVAPKINLV